MRGDPARASRRRADTLGRFADGVETLNDHVGWCLGWLTVTMVCVVCVVALGRYGFSLGWVWLQESYVWIHALVFMLGGAFALRNDAHVRVDIFYRRAGPRGRAMVDLAGTLLLALPFAAVVAWTSAPYVAASWRTFESSREAGGLAGLFVLKSVLLLAPALIALQALAMAARALLVLGKDAAEPRE